MYLGMMFPWDHQIERVFCPLWDDGSPVLRLGEPLLQIVTRINHLGETVSFSRLYVKGYGWNSPTTYRPLMYLLK
jgi:hypothetical protein